MGKTRKEKSSGTQSPQSPLRVRHGSYGNRTRVFPGSRFEEAVVELTQRLGLLESPSTSTASGSSFRARASVNNESHVRASKIRDAVQGPSPRTACPASCQRSKNGESSVGLSQSELRSFPERTPRKSGVKPGVRSGAVAERKIFPRNQVSSDNSDSDSDCVLLTSPIAVNRRRPKEGRRKPEPRKKLALKRCAAEARDHERSNNRQKRRRKQDRIVESSSSSSSSCSDSDLEMSVRENIAILKEQMSTIQKNQDILKKKLDEIERRRRRARPRRNPFGLPMTNVSDLNLLNELVRSDSDADCELFDELYCVGGSTIEKCTKNVLIKLMTNDAARKLSWEGRSNTTKQGFRSYKLCEIIVAVVRKRFGDEASDTEVHAIIKEWLRVAEFRFSKCQRH